MCYMLKLQQSYNYILDYIAGISDDKRGLTKSSLSQKETQLVNNFRKLDEVAQGRILERTEVLLSNSNI